MTTSPDPEDHDAAREALAGRDDALPTVLRAYFANPFLRLRDEEVAFAMNGLEPKALAGLLHAREAATRVRSTRIAVFCMPKSGSSFVESAIRHALDLPMASLTSFGAPDLSSRFGMNSREQELDELAVVKSILARRQCFVAQHHTRCSPYLARQLRRYAIRPVVTTRNLLDCIVSFDEMMLAWRGAPQPTPWHADAAFALPVDYPDLPPSERYDILARSFGTWLIAFHLSWKRCADEGMI